MNNKLANAFVKIRRNAFLPDDAVSLSNHDSPLPIGYGQTNSQPSLVYDMLDKLDLAPGQKVLDVGCGSGWTTALIDELVSPGGYVVGTELIPELADTAIANCNKFALNNISIQNTTQELGFKKQAPYDRILVSAEANNLPTSLIEQLSGDNGRMIIPVKGQLWIVEKHGDKITTTKEYDVAFVPLIY